MKWTTNQLLLFSLSLQNLLIPLALSVIVITFLTDGLSVFIPKGEYIPVVNILSIYQIQ